MDVRGSDVYSCSSVHMHIQRHMCVYTCAWGCLVMSAVFPNSSWPYIVRKGLTMDLGLRWLTGLASQWTAKIYLSLQPTPALGLQMNASSVNVGARDFNHLILMIAWWELYQRASLSPQCCCSQPLSSSRLGWLRSGSPSFLVKPRSHIGISVHQWEAEFQDSRCSLSPGKRGLTGTSPVDIGKVF